MSFFHFINCIALSFAPYFIIYKYSGINEYSSIWKCATASGGYLLTQLIKMLLLATFFPALDGEGFSILPEFLKSSADIVDVIGLHMLMTNFLAGKGEVRFVVGSLGWGFAHSVSHRLVLLWVGARGSAFTWRWIQTSLDSSADLMVIVSMACLTWMITRSQNKTIITPVLAMCVYSTFVYQSIQHGFSLYGWSLLAFRFVYSIATAVLTIIVYSANRTSVARKNE
ncbi:Protein CBG16516 [Caenorhabditis briggsae]|uniref:BOS complex subunit TMEM147 n=3 Tax=Caenorhabditis briggsae TaxID=6238 RepID=A0AAE9EJZ1_CAEBR|nr:Protein CBG16516 [Caenorhabditis briggsae]ULU01031.1 hypothetical protein L3Y34_001434 [Caenorhabditis briggsae]UMM23690.1 hypothetical protein L5515_004288 [Caenorhabditis briggsae]CAP34459.1 Protein CBG16516 [Caenorhabditis briggsae]